MQFLVFIWLVLVAEIYSQATTTNGPTSTFKLIGRLSTTISKVESTMDPNKMTGSTLETLEKRTTESKPTSNENSTKLGITTTDFEIFSSLLITSTANLAVTSSPTANSQSDSISGIQDLTTSNELKGKHSTTSEISTSTTTTASDSTSLSFSTTPSPYARPFNCSNVKDDLNNDLSYCCQIPRLSVTSDVYFACQKFCDNLNKPDDRCCMMSCCFTRIGVVVDKIFDVNSMRNSFLYYVYGDPVWAEVINESVGYCYGRAMEEHLMSNSTLDCEAIPYHAYRVIDCVYARNYVNCPEVNWNLSENEFCGGSEDYVEECLEWPGK